MKKLKVYTYQKVYVTYEVEVPDDLDIDSDYSSHVLYNAYMDGGLDFVRVDDDVEQIEVDYVEEVK